MASEVGWDMSVILVAAAAAHIGEETVAGFRNFFNTKWFSGNEDCPVTRFKGLVIDKIGLFLLLTLLALLGSLVDDLWILIAVGIIVADIVQHAAFSIVMRGYTPGVATCAVYFVYIVYFFGQSDLQDILDAPLAWGAMALGAIFIAGNYLIAHRKVRRGDCQPVSA